MSVVVYATCMIFEAIASRLEVIAIGSQGLAGLRGCVMCLQSGPIPHRAGIVRYRIVLAAFSAFVGNIFSASHCKLI